MDLITENLKLEQQICKQSKTKEEEVYLQGIPFLEFEIKLSKSEGIKRDAS